MDGRACEAHGEGPGEEHGARGREGGRGEVEVARGGVAVARGEGDLVAARVAVAVGGGDGDLVVVGCAFFLLPSLDISTIVVVVILLAAVVGRNVKIMLWIYRAV